MENTIDWSTWIIAGSTVATAGATIALFVITRRYVRLTREMLESSYKPEVVLRLLRTNRTYTREEGPEIIIHRLFVEAKNIGPGVARKVTFEGHRSFNPHKVPVKMVLTAFFQGRNENQVNYHTVQSYDLFVERKKYCEKYRIQIVAKFFRKELHLFEGLSSLVHLNFYPSALKSMNRH